MITPPVLWRNPLILVGRHIRLEPEIEAWDLDDTEHLDNLRALATKDFALHSDAISRIQETK